MILIITNQYEPTTDYVIDWLIEKKADFYRINSEDMTQQTAINDFSLSDDNTIELAGKKLYLPDIHVVWYRRWYDYRNTITRAVDKYHRQAIIESREEATQVSYYLFKLLRHKKWLSDPFQNQSHNKLHTLKLAKQVGLTVPDTLVTNSKARLRAFYEKHQGGIITKPVSDPYVFISDNGDNYKSFTEKITSGFIDALEDQFFLSQFQSYVKGKYELRIFYLDGQFYPTAIIHSGTTDIKLSVSYQVSRINMIAYCLPEDIIAKLQRLMNVLGLNTASIDMLETEDGHITFLEVNPVGQFMGYATHNNYQIDEKIAEWLVKNDRPHEKEKKEDQFR
ncbi:MvdC/MvdD family ATP grasp protein [Chitinophaga vietnamensis]|uniref:MvdC/MvdD family ATP grasp protein n=1 Tax=Chitinophaga vietnamensis TaxID=2593957 RepID=UPI0011777650|nr:hypothetical protein [Chitinophaga vietnamensis]